MFAELSTKTVSTADRRSVPVFLSGVRDKVNTQEAIDPVKRAFEGGVRKGAGTGA